MIASLLQYRGDNAGIAVHNLRSVMSADASSRYEQGFTYEDKDLLYRVANQYMLAMCKSGLDENTVGVAELIRVKAVEIMQPGFIDYECFVDYDDCGYVFFVDKSRVPCDFKDGHYKVSLTLKMPTEAWKVASDGAPGVNNFSRFPCSLRVNLLEHVEPMRGRELGLFEYWKNEFWRTFLGSDD